MVTVTDPPADGHAKDGRVGEVEELGPQLRQHPFNNLETLSQGNVGVGNAVLPEFVHVPRGRSLLEAARRGEDVRVEPAFRRRIAEIGVSADVGAFYAIAERTQRVRGPNIDRDSRAEPDGAGDLPAAYESNQPALLEQLRYD